MNSLFVLLLTMSIAASWIFGWVLLIERFCGRNYIQCLYWMMKIILLFYAAPIALLAQVILERKKGYAIEIVQGEDFFKIISIGNRNIEEIPHGYEWVLSILVVWGIGILFFYFIIFIKGKKTLKLIINNSVLVTEERILAIEENLKIELNLKKSPPIYQSRLVSSPFLMGIINAKIVVPKRDFSVYEWEMILKHELIHLEGWDLLFKLVAGIVQGLHWFNPVVYFFKLRFFEFSEYACDQKTMAFFDNEQRYQYARLIVSLALENPEYKQISMFSDKAYNVLERRIYQIMKKSKKRGTFLIVGISAFILSCPIVTYASATSIVYMQNEIVKRKQEEGLVMKAGEIPKGSSRLNPLMASAIASGAIESRGNNQIDTIVPATGQIYFNSISLAKGNKIDIILSGDNSKDSFSVNVADSNGKGISYQSNRGMVFGTFTAPSAGKYTVYVDGKNYDGNDIHLTGLIRIEYLKGSAETK